MQYIFDLFMIPIRHHAETFTCLWLLFGGRDTRSMTVVERHVLRPSYDVYYGRSTFTVWAKSIVHDTIKGYISRRFIVEI